MPDMYMIVDTALSEVPVNKVPLIDDTDFKTRETGVAYNATGMDLVWNFTTTGGATTQTAVTPTTAGDYDWAEQGDAMYTIEIPASGGASINNDTEGFGWFSGVITGILPFVGPIIQFSPANVINSLVNGSDALDVNTIQVGGTTQTANDMSGDIDAILVDTNELQTDDIPGAISALNDPTAATIADAVWDEVLSAAQHNVANSAGRRVRQLQDFGVYALAAVWVDETSGTSTGTTDFEDGTVTNRSNDFDNAQTIAASVGLNRIFIANGNSITLAATINNFEIGVPGGNWTLALGGQDIGGCYINDASLSGTATGTNPHFHRCLIGTATLPPAEFFHCGLGAGSGTLTVGSAGAYRFIDCYSDVAGAASPVVDLGAAVGATTMEFRRWSGGLTLNNVATGDVVSVDVVSGGTITVNGTGGTVVIRGMCNVVDGSSGSVTITETSVVNMTKINTEADTAISDAALATASALATVDSNVDAVLVDTGTTIPGTITTLQSSVDAIPTSNNIVLTTTIATLTSQTEFTLTAGSSDNNAYNGCTVIITDQSTATQKSMDVVNDYAGTTKTITLQNNPSVFTIAVGDTVEILANHANVMHWNKNRILSPSDGRIQVDLQSIGTSTTPITNLRDDYDGTGYNKANSTIGTVTTVDTTGQNAIRDAILDNQIADSIPSVGTLPTIEQALYILTQAELESSVSGTTVTVKKADGSTTLYTKTLDDATTPTSYTRAT